MLILQFDLLALLVQRKRLRHILMFRQVYHRDLELHKYTIINKVNKLTNKNLAMNHGIRKSDEGFTLIETLVAISILMIAISGPLVVANKSLTAALYAKDQTTASYLAQEILESIRNEKDNSNARMDDNSQGNGWYKSLSGKDCTQITNPCPVSNTVGSGSRLAFDLLDPRFELSYYYTNIPSNNDEKIVT